MKKSCVLLLALVVAFGVTLAVGPSAAQTQDQYVSVDKYLSSSTIGCDDQVQVTLIVSGVRPTKPVDVILVIDRSGSMSSTPLSDAKNAAKAFVDMLYFTSDAVTTDMVGVVSYSTWGSLDIGLTSDEEAVKAKIDSLSGGGFTNIGDAVFKAQAELNSSRTYASDVMIVLSDGVANRDHAGHVCDSWPTTDTLCTLDAIYQASVAKSVGTAIFTVGLNLDDVEESHPGSGVLAEHTLQTLASGPSYYFEATESGYLMEIYQTISEIIAPAATDLTIVDYVTPGFEVVPGTVNPEGIVDGNVEEGYVIVWTFDTLGDETRYFTYNITRDPALNPGSYDANIEAALSFTDWQGNPAQLIFPNPQIEVVGDCGGGQVLILGISINKTADLTQAEIGDVVHYTFEVNNTGNVNLTDVNVVDDKLGPIVTPVSGDSDGDGELDVGEVWVYIAAHEIDQTEDDPLVNNATVTGEYEGETVSDWDTWSVDVLPPPPEASVWVSDSSFCLLNTNGDGQRVFRVVITPKRPSYKISSTNPGQFYLNIIVPYSGGDVNITAVIPVDFRVKNGERGVHIYSNAESYECNGETWRPDYGSDITSSFTISVEQLGMTGGFRNGQHQTRVVVLSSDDRADSISQIYVTIHFEYALRGMTVSSSEFEYFTGTSYDFNVYVNSVAVDPASIVSTSKLPHVHSPKDWLAIPPGQAKKN